MTAVLLVILAVPYILLSYFEATSGYMISYTTAWYFFVLLNAFYGGALTMFFTSQVQKFCSLYFFSKKSILILLVQASVPFESIRDVMRAYPTWKLLIMDGNQVSSFGFVQPTFFFTLSYVFQVNYQFQVAAGDPDYVNFWQRLESNPEEALFKDIGEGETKKRPIAFLPHFAPPYVISQNGKMLDFF